MTGEILLRIEAVAKLYQGRRKGLFGRGAPHAALKGINLDLRRGEILAIVGESGSGKSTLARIVARLISPSSGRVVGEELPPFGSGLTREFCRQVQLIQQDTGGSLDPRMTVGAQLCEVLSIHGMRDAGTRKRRALELLHEVGLSSEMFERPPHRLSGGQRQRVVIARALTVDPVLLICDEPVSSLDITVQAQIVDLLLGLRRDRGTTLLFITHDLMLARRIADRVAVMYAGELVEIGTAAEVLEHPRHDYTRNLIAAGLPRRQARLLALARHDETGSPSPVEVE